MQYSATIELFYEPVNLARSIEATSGGHSWYQLLRVNLISSGSFTWRSIGPRDLTTIIAYGHQENNKDIVGEAFHRGDKLLDGVRLVGPDPSQATGLNLVRFWMRVELAIPRSEKNAPNTF